MSKSSGHNKNRIKNKSKKITKKNYEKKNSMKGGLPPTNILSQFKISDDNIYNFRRFVSSSNDCVITAMQIIGMLDNITANLLRIALNKNAALGKDQIERIFTLYTGNLFDFISTRNFDEFLNYLRENLRPGNVVFAGHSNNLSIETYGHAFIIGRTTDRKLLYIDPSISAICDLESKECNELISGNHAPWYLLHNSERTLSIDELRNMGFTI